MTKYGLSNDVQVDFIMSNPDSGFDPSSVCGAIIEFDQDIKVSRIGIRITDTYLDKVGMKVLNYTGDNSQSTITYYTSPIEVMRVGWQYFDIPIELIFEKNKKYRLQFDLYNGENGYNNYKVGCDITNIFPVVSESEGIIAKTYQMQYPSTVTSGVVTYWICFSDRALNVRIMGGL